MPSKPSRHIPDTTDRDELFHYGVNGMKWGVPRKEHPNTKMSNNEIMRSLGV